MLQRYKFENVRARKEAIYKLDKQQALSEVVVASSGMVENDCD